MNWKEKLSILEQHDDFDIAIFYMQEVIKAHPDDVGAYIYMLFRLMDTIVEHACYFSNVSKVVSLIGLSITSYMGRLLKTRQIGFPQNCELPKTMSMS